MSDRELLILSLLCSVLGLSLMLLATNLREAERVTIEEIEPKDVGRFVAVEGNVCSSYYNKHLFFEIKDETGKIKVVVFENSINDLGIEPKSLEKGREVRVEGFVKRYRGEMEIIPERIWIK